MSTMSIDIPLAGLSTSPCDRNISDGHFTIAVNTIHEEGEILNSSSNSPSVVLNLGNDVVIFQHKNQTYKHLICRNGTNNLYYWISAVGDKYEFGEYFSEKYIGEGVDYKISSVGNSLIFYSETHIFYFLWTNNKYKELGEQIPEINMNFGLVQYNNICRNQKDEEYGCVNEDDIKVFSTADFEEQKGLDVSDLNSAVATNAVMGKISEFIYNETKKGRFVHPFIIRYAYRLYDGSLTLHSCPVLMVTNTGMSPVAVVHSFKWTDHIRSKPTSVNFYIEGQSYVIDYKADIHGEIEEWSDIVKSVDIFVSSQFYPYDQDGKIEGYRTGDGVMQVSKDVLYEIIPTPCYHNFDKYITVCKLHIDQEKETHYADADIYKKRIISESSNYNVNDNGIYFNGEGYRYRSSGNNTIPPPVITFDIPQKSKEHINKDIKECGNFYFIKSIKLEDLETSSRTEIDLEGSLENIETHELMSGEYYSHENIIPNGTNEYNKRINYVGAKRELKYAPSINTLVTYQDVGNFPSDIRTNYKIIEDGKEIILQGEGSKSSGQYSLYIPYVCYNNPSAKMLQVSYYKYDNVRVSNINLEEHVSLNASIAFNGFGRIQDDIIGDNISPELIPTKDNIVYENETVYTSDVNNPFSFSSSNVEQIGTGEIIAMVPAAVALSQGQFGEFPMYCFTTEGIWALYPNETGGWASKQPISRDVALSASSILQLDQTVIFATDRGLMEIEGSKIVCISEMFDGPEDTFLKMYKAPLTTVIGRNTDIAETNLFPSFKEYIKTCNMHYDYTHQRVILSNANSPVCFVYNMKDGVWTTELLNVTSAINSYPQAYAMAKVGTSNILIDFTQEGDPADVGMPNNGFLLTRPLKLDSADSLKTVRTVIARGNFQTNTGHGDTRKAGHVDLILYGSRDLRNWVTIGSCKGDRLTLYHGSAFKYFRVGIITRLEEGESLSSLTIEFEDKQFDKIR